VSSEYILQYSVNDAFGALNAHPEAARDFLGVLSEYDPDKFAEAMNYFAGNIVKVVLSYPTQPPPTQQAVVVALVLGSEAQTEGYIGNDMGSEEEETAQGDPISLTQYFGRPVTATFQFIVFAFNADLCIWASRAIRWALMAQSDRLSQFAGMNIMDISMQDWAPDKRYAPDIVLRRVVTVTVRETDVYSIGYGDFITDFKVRVVDPDTIHPIFVEE